MSIKRQKRCCSKIRIDTFVRLRLFVLILLIRQFLYYVSLTRLRIFLYLFFTIKLLVTGSLRYDSQIFIWESCKQYIIILKMKIITNKLKIEVAETVQSYLNLLSVLISPMIILSFNICCYFRKINSARSRNNFNCLKSSKLCFHLSTVCSLVRYSIVLSHWNLKFCQCVYFSLAMERVNNE